MPHRLQVRARADQYFAYSGRCLLATDLEGWISGAANQGFYAINTRLLSRDELLVRGKRPRPICATPVGGDGLLAYGEFGEEHGLPHKAVYAEVARFVGEGLRTRLRLTNYSREHHTSFDLALALSADFADVVETERRRREQTADVETTWDETRRTLTFRYCNPDLRRSVQVKVEAPMAVDWTGEALRAHVALAPRQQIELELSAEPILGDHHLQPPARSTFREAPTIAATVTRELAAEAPRLVSSNATVVKAWETAVQDLASLPLGIPEGRAMAIAGVPLYQQVFGRDALTIGWQALLAMRRPLRDALRANAAFLGERVDDWYDEEPGKMLHQRREGPLSSLGKNALLRYYGDYATEPDFLIMLPQYLFWTGDRKTARELLPAARAALSWLERFADLDNDGFIEYVTRSPKGVKNQGWKDSKEAIVDERGALVDNPIATSELQAYWYAGLQQMALLTALLGDIGAAQELRRKASALKQRFDRAFWMPEEGFYALALGPDKQQIRTVASNAGHLLASGIVPRAKGRRVAERLMADDLFTGWGIRTLSSSHPSYNPFSYHLGSMWPVENGTFALGFGRYGCHDLLHRLAKAMFDTTELFVEHRLPEAVGGLQRDDLHPHPGIYAASNEPQGWSASAIVLIVQSLLGIRPVAPLGLLVLDPQLPDWLPDLRLEGVRIGPATVDVEATRAGDGTTRHAVRVRKGSMRVVRQPAPDASDTSLARRLAAAAVSIR